MNRSIPVADPALAELVEELTARLKAGEAVNLDAWLAERPEHAEQLRELFPTLRLLAELSRSGDLSAPPMTPEDAVTGILGDFRIVREVGRGGMGIVYEAEQVSLGRRVALKVLPFAATLDPRQLQRFHNEARAAAGLHHTNIVPVFAVGCERGVHYYAMQFIDGRTLADLIAEQRGGPPSQVPTVAAPEAVASATTPSPAAQATSAAPRDRAYFRRAAAWGIQAAEALDCAHALGVVHRDVKPANLMVDTAGRLWVTDFGLAQVQSDARLTMTGDLVGTLRYMSPEQALAKRVVVDHRTDVYSLGATLYELLTLQPAFAGTDRQELLRQIAFEESTAPRRINRAIPAELETIVLKAMEKSPADRYATAKDLADDLRHWLEDRPIRARRPSLVQRARKWARRHKPLVGAVAAVLVVAALLGGAVSVSWVRTRAAAEGESRVLLQQAQRLAQEEKWDEALGAVEHAQGLLTAVGADPALRREAERLAKDLPMVIRLEQVRLDGAVLLGPERFKVVGRGYAAAFADYGLDVAALDARAVADRVRDSAIRIHLLEGLDDWAYVRDRLHKGDGEPQRGVARLADDDPWRQQLRDPQVRGDRAALERLAQDEAALAQPPAVLRWLSELLISAGAPEAQVRLLRAAQQRRPGEYYTNEHVAYCLARNPATRAEAIGFYRAALAIRPQSPAAHHNLGAGLDKNGQLDEAIAEYREAIRLKKDFTAARINLAPLLTEKGLADEAIAELREAIRLDKDNLAYAAHNSLGSTLTKKGKLDEAIAEFREALRLKPDFAAAHNNLGDILESNGRFDEAIAELREAIRLMPKRAEPHGCLGMTLLQKGQLDEAIAELREAIRLNPNLAEPHSNLGLILLHKGKLDEAIAESREAIRLKPATAAAHNNLGIALHRKGRLDEAIVEFREALRLQNDVPEGHACFGAALRDKGRLQEAILEYREALRLKPAYPGVASALAMLYVETGRWADAEPIFREDAGKVRQQAGPESQQYANVLAVLGLSLLKQEKYRQAEEVLRPCLAFREKKEPDAWNTFNAKSVLGGALLGQQKYADAEPLLLQGYEGMRQRQDKIPPAGKVRLPEALERLVQLYDAWGKKDQADRWRKEFGATRAKQEK